MIRRLLLYAVVLPSCHGSPCLELALAATEPAQRIVRVGFVTIPESTLLRADGVLR